jgi:predicted GIY-YIG superfamily endonuclease
MKSFYVYIVQCADKSYYVGHTDDIEKRIAEHNSQTYRCYTTTRLPIELVFLQDFGSRDEAFACERQIKKWRRQKKEALIAQSWDRLKLLAKKQFV